MKIIYEKHSPNFNDRKSNIDIIVIHYTGMKSEQESLEQLCNTSSKVSSHFLINYSGDIFSLVEEEKRAWHAGVSFWNGENDINSSSIGIELDNPGHDYGYKPLDFLLIQVLHNIWNYHIFPLFLPYSKISI